MNSNHHHSASNQHGEAAGPQVVVLRPKDAADVVAAAVRALGMIPTLGSVAVLLTWTTLADGVQRPGALRFDTDQTDEMGEVFESLSDRYGRYTVTAVVLADVDKVAQVADRLGDMVPVSVVVATDLATATCVSGPYGPEPQPLDLHAHPYLVDAMASGGVPRTCEQIAASLEPATNTRAGVVTVAAIASHRIKEATERRDWVSTALAIHDTAMNGRDVDTDDLAHLLAATEVIPVRDLLWSQITRENATRAADVWSWVATRTPETAAVAPLALAGFAAWLSGDGYRARVAVERAHQVNPDYSMADLVGQVAASGIAPSTWEDLPTEQIRADVDTLTGRD